MNNESYYALKDAMREWFNENPGATENDWNKLPYGERNEYISEKMIEYGYEEVEQFGTNSTIWRKKEESNEQDNVQEGKRKEDNISPSAPTNFE